MTARYEAQCPHCEEWSDAESYPHREPPPLGTGPHGEPISIGLYVMRPAAIRQMKTRSVGYE